MPDTRKYVDYQGLNLYDSKLKKWTKDLLEKNKPIPTKSDWNENDPNSDAYIENRTHYKSPSYWNYSDESFKYSGYSEGTEGSVNEIYPDLYLYEVSLDNGEVYETFTQYCDVWDCYSMGNSDYFPCQTSRGWKLAEASLESDINFSITNLSNDNRTILSADDGLAHTVNIQSTGLKIPFFENHYVDMDHNLTISETLVEGQEYTVYIDGEPVYLTASKAEFTNSEGETQYGIILGNPEVVDYGYTIISLVAQEHVESISYDKTIDVDQEIGILIPIEDGEQAPIGLFFSRYRNITTAAFENEEDINIELINIYDYMGESEPAEVNITIETEPVNYKAKIVPITNSSDESIISFGYAVENNEEIRVVFNGKAYDLKVHEADDSWDSIYYNATIYSGTKDWGWFYLLGDNTTPFIICCYDAFRFNNQDYSFVEVAFKEEYNNQPISLQIQTCTGYDVHQLGKEYIPNPLWEEVEEKPNWVSKKDVLSIFWGDTSSLFTIDNGGLYFADGVVPTEIDYPVMLPSDINGERATTVYAQLRNTQIPSLYYEEGLNVGTEAQNMASLKEVYVDSDYVSSNAFKNDTNLEIAELSDSIYSLGQSAFEGCTSLKKVNIPRGIDTLSSYLFNGCSNLESILIPKNITDDLVGSYIFTGCNKCNVTFENGITAIPGQILYYANIKSVNIPSSVTTIGRAAFCNSNITEIDLPESVTEIGSTAFKGTHLTSVSIPEGVTYIASEVFQECPDLEYVEGENLSGASTYAFKGCTSLQEVYTGKDSFAVGYNTFDGCNSLTTIPNIDCTTSIGNYAFRNCTSLTNVTLVGEGRGYTNNYIGEYAFNNCTSLTSIEIPEKVYWIKQYAFQGCTSLSQITLHEGLYRIDSYAFSSNTSLTSIDIPSTVRILSDAFRNTTNLTTLTVRSTTPPSLNYSYSLPSSLQHIYVPAEAVDTYKSTNRWSDFASIIEAIQ